MLRSVFKNSHGQPIMSCLAGIPTLYNECPCKPCPCDHYICDISAIFVLNEFYPGVTDFDPTQAVFWCDFQDGDETIAVPRTYTTYPYGGSLTGENARIYFYGKRNIDEDGRDLTEYFTHEEIMQMTKPKGKSLHCLSDANFAETQFYILKDGHPIHIRMCARFATLPVAMNLDIAHPTQATDTYLNELSIDVQTANVETQKLSDTRTSRINLYRKADILSSADTRSRGRSRILMSKKTKTKNLMDMSCLPANSTVFFHTAEQTGSTSHPHSTGKY